MSSDTYLQSAAQTSGSQHPLIRAFDANERIKSHYANVDFPEGAYDDELIQFVRGNLRLRVRLPRPRTRFDRILSFPLTKQLDQKAMANDALNYSQDMAAYSVKVAATGGLLSLFEGPPQLPNPTQYEVVAREAIFDAFMSLDANFDSVPPAQCIRIKNFKSPASVAAGVLGFLTPKFTTPLEFFAENTEDRKQWQAYADVLGYLDVLTMLNAYFAGNLISEWDTIFYNDIAPVVFEKIVSALRLSEIATDFSSEGKYKGGESIMRLNVTGTTSRKRNQLPLRLRLDVMNSKMKALQEFVILDIQDVNITYATAHYNGVLFSGSVNNDLLDGAELYIPENSEEKRNPRKEDAYLVGKLIEHLNSNLEHYNKVLWYNLDADRRYMLLDGFGIQTYNDFGLPVDKDNQPIPLRSLASVVKNELIAIVGNSMVFPVAAGYRVGKDFVDQLVEVDTEDRTEGNAITKKKRISLFEHYKPLTPIEPFRISVPTKGVFLEAVQGACNACEKIETDRVQDWTRFPNPDEPTPIGTVTPPTPGVTDWRAAFKDFATPIVNIQNTPGSPAPGAGLAGLADLLGKSDVFKDITGLDQNQKNAIQTYLSNQENAKAFAEMAKEMAMQSHNTQNTGNIMDSIKQAKDSGDISKEDASQLTKDHIQQKIDGGQTKKAELEKEKQTSDDTKAATEAMRRIPGDSIGEVVCKDQTGKETLVKATPKPRPPSKGLRNVLVTLTTAITRVGETGSTPLNGNLSIGFGLPGTENSSGGEFRRVLFSIYTGVDFRNVSLRAEAYVLRPSYQPAAASDLTFLHGLQLGAAGVDVPALIGGILDYFSQNMSALTKGTIATIAPTQNRLNLSFKAQVRKMDEGNAVTLKLDESAGFNVGADSKVSFNSAELPKLIAKLAPFLRDPRAVAIGEGVAALLSLFTVTSNIDSNGKLTGSVEGGVQIKLIPALLESAELTVV